MHPIPNGSSVKTIKIISQRAFVWNRGLVDICFDDKKTRFGINVLS